MALPMPLAYASYIGIMPGSLSGGAPIKFHLLLTSRLCRLRCLDCNKMVDNWYAVDDGSSAEELAEMKAIAPNVKWLEKPADQSGHPGSINALMQVAAGYDYFVWLEDDWFYIKDDYMVSKALQVFRAEPDAGQVRCP